MEQNNLFKRDLKNVIQNNNKKVRIIEHRWRCHPSTCKNDPLKREFCE